MAAPVAHPYVLAPKKGHREGRGFWRGAARCVRLECLHEEFYISRNLRRMCHHFSARCAERSQGLALVRCPCAYGSRRKRESPSSWIRISVTTSMTRTRRAGVERAGDHPLPALRLPSATPSSERNCSEPLAAADQLDGHIPVMIGVPTKATSVFTQAAYAKKTGIIPADAWLYERLPFHKFQPQKGERRII